MRYWTCLINLAAIVTGLVVRTQTIPTLDIGERGFIVGLSGSGKSEVAKRLIPSTGTRVVIDPKREFQVRGERVINDPSKFRVIEGKLNVYRPHPDLLTDIPSYDEVLRKVYNTGNVFLYLDEVTPLMNGNKGPKYLQVCYQLGRSKGVTSLASTQRPTCISKVLFTEATKFYVFRLNDLNDIRRMASIVPGYDGTSPVPYAFTFLDVNTSETPKVMKLKLR